MKKSLFIAAMLLMLGSFTADAEVVDRIVIVVNNEIITQREVDVILAPIYAQYRTMYQGEELIRKLEETREQILKQLIEDRLILSEAKKQNVAVEEKEIDARINDIKKKVGTEADLENMLNEQNLTLKELRERYKEKIMIRKLIDQKVGARIIITPLEVKDYYAAHKEEFLHPEEVKLVGRLKYRTSYGQNVLQHSKEVAYLAGMMASELGINISIVKRAGLLHDIGKAVDHEVEGTHVQIGVDLARKFKEPESVIHAIACHHEDEEPKTVEAILVQVADAISASRPGVRKETLESYMKRLTNLEQIAQGFHGIEKAYAIQAGREIRVMVIPEIVNDQRASQLAKEIAAKIEGELQYPGQIRVTVVRETRITEYAK